MLTQGQDMDIGVYAPFQDALYVPSVHGNNPNPSSQCIMFFESAQNLIFELNFAIHKIFK